MQSARGCRVVVGLALDEDPVCLCVLSFVVGQKMSVVSNSEVEFV